MMLMLEKEMAYVKELAQLAHLQDGLRKPEDWACIDWKYFLLRLGFKSGGELMIDQGFEDKGEPVTFHVGRSDVLTPEEFEKVYRRR